MSLIIRTAEALEAEARAARRARDAEEARAYLAATDWMVIRAAETGKAIPDDVAARRSAARRILSGDL